MKRLLIFSFLFVVSSNIFGQVSVSASIDKYEIVIGQQSHLTVSVISKEDADVIFPVFQRADTIVNGVEVLSATATSKSPIEEGNVRYDKTYTLTSFDGANYWLPPFEVDVNGKKYQSDSHGLSLKVLEVAIDTTKLEPFPAKNVQDNPFLWSDWSAIFWLSVIMVLLLALGIALYFILRSNKPIKVSLKSVKRLLPHQKALVAIESIKADKIASSENPKEYYTRLTEALRKYIEERYSFNAMEMTSAEIIERLTVAPDAQAIDELRVLFNTADLVKFAKYSTLINENDMNLVNAIDFINSTKIEITEAPITKPKMTVEERQSIKTRRILKVSISAVLIVSLALFVYVIYEIVQLVAN